MMNLFKASFFSQINDSSARAKYGTSFIDAQVVDIFTFLMRSIMMRHSQNQKYTGTNTTLMSLPPKVRIMSRSKRYILLD